MKFLIDNQLPPALARFIQSEYACSAVHVVDIGMRDASDAELWHYASKTQSVLIPKDEDFANMALQTPTATLIWVRVRNCQKPMLLDLFRRVWPRLLGLLESGDRVIELH